MKKNFFKLTATLFKIALVNADTALCQLPQISIYSDAKAAVSAAYVNFEGGSIPIDDNTNHNN